MMTKLKTLPWLIAPALLLGGTTAATRTVAAPTTITDVSLAHRNGEATLLIGVEGPELPDLRLVSIVYNHTDPSMSLATFQDVGNKKRYNVRPGDRIGRLVVADIELSEATLRVNDYGTVREQTYSLARGEDGNP